MTGFETLIVPLTYIGVALIFFGVLAAFEEWTR